MTSDGPGYDPSERRLTPLAKRLCRSIPAEGLSLSAYMRCCLLDAEHGYYNRKAVLGRDGDFITAPEISQVFGELIGLWCGVVWQGMGSPSRASLVELGPGRGTLMVDAMRAARRVPGFSEALDIHLLEASPRMQELQGEALRSSNHALSWPASLADLPRQATIVIGNEFLDALPIEQAQFRRSAGGVFDWHMRHVGVDEYGSSLTDEWRRIDRRARDHWRLPGAPTEGMVVERPDHGSLIEDIAALASEAPLAALFVDYGYVTGHGDSLQAVRNHRYEHPLTAPGEADLSAHVDFGGLAGRFLEYGLAVNGPVTQAEFLGSLGIVERASRLMALNPAKAAMIEAGVARLMAPGGMGTRFKAVGIGSPGLPPLPGFPTSQQES